MIPTKTDDPQDLTDLNTFIETLPNVERVEVLPYHTMGVYKWKELGLEYPLEGINAPESPVVEMANELLGTAKYN